MDGEVGSSGQMAEGSWQRTVGRWQLAKSKKQKGKKQKANSNGQLARSSEKLVIRKFAIHRKNKSDRSKHQTKNTKQKTT